MVTRLSGTILVALSLSTAGCQAGGLFAPKPVEIARASGQWQKTFIGVQKYNNALLRDKKTGKVLDPEDAREMPMDAYTVEAGDIEDLTYRAGRVRYSFTARDAGAQPYVVERPVKEADFEALDAALYADKFFGMPEKNWATERFPMFYVQYDQAGKGAKASFTPNLNRLVKAGPILNAYMAQLNGEDSLPAGTRQYAYYLTPKAGQLSIAVATLSANATGAGTETPWVLKSVSYDVGAGSQAATVEAGGARFTMPIPKGDGNTQLVGLTITAEGDPGTWETLIPVRTTK